MEDRPNRLLFDMQRSLFLLIAAIVAFLRIFIIGIVAILFGMSDYGGVTSALLRIFQLYNLLFVYIVLIQYIKAGAREYLRKPSLIVACVSPILSVLALFASILFQLT
jgi:magnesium-transporting ATPase (P-type)